MSGDTHGSEAQSHDHREPLMTIQSQLPYPQYLSAADERPHVAGDAEHWSENYLTYVWSPTNDVGIYIHLCRLPGEVALWDEVLFIALPDERWLVSKSVSPARPCDDGVAVNGMRWVCDVPFQRWTKRFCGGAQLVTDAELADGALRDGDHVPVEFDLSCEAMSPAFDFGEAMADQAWATGHYEQHVRIAGTLRFGGETLEISGTGLRDHSWGPRDYRRIGYTTWLNAQFPESGRALMAVRATGVPPAPSLAFATVYDDGQLLAATAADLPMAHSVEDAEAGFSFALTVNGSETLVKCETLRATRASFLGPASLVLGTDQRPTCNHDYIDTFARFTWDGEVGYGIVDRTVDRYPGSEPPEQRGV